jgi:hypothetical protein
MQLMVMTEIDHDADALGNKRRLLSYVISKTKEDHEIYLDLLNNF